MMSLITEFTNWITTLPEPLSLLLLGSFLIAITFTLRRAPAAAGPQRKPRPKLVHRRIGSARGLTAQRGHS